MEFARRFLEAKVTELKQNIERLDLENVTGGEG